MIDADGKLDFIIRNGLFNLADPATQSQHDRGHELFTYLPAKPTSYYFRAAVLADMTTIAPNIAWHLS